jgi:peptide/nickel transport system permease protein
VSVTETALPEPLSAQPALRPRTAHPLLRFVLRRVATGLLTLAVASFVVFLGTAVVPGSPATAVLGRLANKQVVAQVDRRIGYDKPLPERYVTWLFGALHGDFGNSAVALAQGATSAPIWPIIRDPLLNTTTLAVITVIFLIPLSLLLGVIAGLTHGRLPDHVISVLTLVFMALPEFVVGALLVVIFFVVLNLLPPVSLLSPGAKPWSDPQILVMPVLTLLAVSVAWTVRLVRVGTIETIRTDYVQMARLQGLPERKVVRRYVLRNALAPSVQIFALSIQYLFGGVIVTETVFDYPGLGNQLLQAVTSHDDTQVQAIAFILAGVYIAINIIADLIVLVLVPKLRTQT